MSFQDGPLESKKVSIGLSLANVLINNNPALRETQSKVIRYIDHLVYKDCEFSVVSHAGIPW